MRIRSWFCFLLTCLFISSLSAAHLFWTDGRHIWRAELDGSEAQIIVTPGGSTPIGIAVDASRGKLYWVNGFGSEILLQRANVDGSQLENLVSRAVAPGLGWGRPASLAIDAVGALTEGVPKLYIGATDTDHLVRANLEGTDVETVVAGLPNDSYVNGVAIDVPGQSIYWANCCPDDGPPAINRAKLGEENYESIVTGVDPAGIALDLFAHEIYWFSRDSGSIWRAHQDGTMAELVVTNAGDYSPLALNRADGKIYWGDPHNLWQADLDGGNRQLLVAGTNRIAGIAIDSGLPPQAIPVLALTNTWKYHQNGVDLGTAWKEPGFDDESWPFGQAVLGEDNNAAVAPLIRTPLRLETNGFRTITYYFRTHFQVTNLSDNYLLTFSNLVDDGAVFYLNGSEILRVNMPPVPVTYETRAAMAVPNFREGILEVTNASADLLVVGDNVLAVEVHQSDLDSTDIVFATAVHLAPISPLYFIQQPTNSAPAEGGSTILTGRVASSPVHYQWFMNGEPLASGTNNTLFLIPVTRAQAGHYYLVASNQLGAMTSAVATVTVVLAQDESEPIFLLSAQQPSDGSSGILVTFSQALDLISSTQAANYAIHRADTGASVAISNAGQSGAHAVRLITAPLIPGQNYILTVNGVRSEGGTEIEEDSQVSVATRMSLWPFNTVWRYNDSGNDLGTSWRERNFDDASWAAGPGLLHNDESFMAPLGTTPATIVNVTNAAGQSIVTHYFRHHFDLAAEPGRARLTLRYIVDDGAIFYLNGVEIARRNMPPGNVTAATRASSSALEGVIVEETLSTASLAAGDNVLAVEVHQFSLTSPDFPDLSFGVEATLVADSFASISPRVLRHPRSQTVSELTPAVFSGEVLAATRWQWLRNGTDIPSATNAILTIMSATAADTGVEFALVGSNSQGSVTTSVARLQVLLDVVAPYLLGANMGTNDRQVTVTFSENLQAETATNTSFYGITNEFGESLAVVGATLEHGSNVVLTTASRTAGHRLTLHVDGVRDASGSGNVVRDQIRVGYEMVRLGWDWVWRYDDTGLDRGTSWREPGYDDSFWPQGPGLLGFEDVDTPPAEPIRTMLPPPDYRGPVYYFRTRSSFAPSPAADAVWLRYFADDGAVFFLNGVELHRVAVPPGQNYRTLATRGIEPFVEGPYALATNAFLGGSNTFAVEVHQVSITSADSVFGMQLTEVFGAEPLRALPPRLKFVQSQGQLVLTWDDRRYLLERARSVNGPWQRAAAPTIPYPVEPSGEASFFRLRR